MAVNVVCFCCRYVVHWSVADGNQSRPASDRLTGRKEGAEQSISCHCHVLRIILLPIKELLTTK